MTTPIRVLLVDDEPGYTGALARRLGKRGFTTMEANSGPEALAVMESRPVDVAVLDILMPGMDGVKTLGEIRRLHPDIQVLMLTAYADTDIVISSLAMGAYDYILKPSDTEELIAKIEDAAHQRRRDGVPGKP